jgi:predicted transcriptional regulator
MKKIEAENLKKIAKTLFLSGETQRSISERLGVSEKTVSKWVEGGAWKVLKAARMVTRQELIIKMLKNASDKLDEGTLSADEMIKIASAIEKIDKKTNIVTMYEVFNAYNKWLENRMRLDPELSPELIKLITKYQELYLTESSNNLEISQ